MLISMSQQQSNSIDKQCDELEKLFIELRKYPIGSKQGRKIKDKIFLLLYTGSLKDFCHNTKRKEWTGLTLDERNNLLDSAWAKTMFEPSKNKYGEENSSTFINCYCYIYGTIIDARMFAAWRKFYLKTIARKKEDFFMESINNDEISLFETEFLDKVEISTKLDISIKEELKVFFLDTVKRIKQIDCSERFDTFQNTLWNEWKIFVSSLPAREKIASIKNYILYYYKKRINDGYRKLKKEKEQIQELATQQSSNTEQSDDSLFLEAIQDIEPDPILLLEEDNFRIYSSIFLNKSSTLSFQKLGIVYYSEKKISTKGVWDRTIDEMQTRGYDLKDLKKQTLSPKFSSNEYLFEPIILKTCVNDFEPLRNRLEDYLESNTNNNYTSKVKELLQGIQQEKELRKNSLQQEIVDFENDSVLKSKIGNFKYFAYSKSGVNPQKPDSKSGKSLFISSTKGKFQQIIKQTDNQDFLSRVDILSVWNFENSADSELPLTKIAFETWQEFLQEHLQFQHIKSLDPDEVVVVIRTIIYYYLYVFARLNLTKHILDIKEFILQQQNE